MATRTTNRRLFQIDDNLPNWHHYYNYNTDVFNDTVFKIQGLHDVEVVALQQGSIIKWDSISMEWKVVFNKGMD